MHMRKIDVTPILATQVLEIAYEAGVAILDVYEDIRNRGDDIQKTVLTSKADGSPLTQVDVLAHQLISQRLAVLTPHLQIVSEENASLLPSRASLATGEFWLVDPVDGTQEFLAQNGEFTVNIALVRDGVAVLGVVVAPALGQAYWGGEGFGALRELDCRVESIHVTPRVKPDQPLRVVASKSYMNAETLAFIRQLGASELVQIGSSLKFCRIAEGSADIYPRLGPTCEWDTAAAQAILEAAGGYVSSLDGRPVRYGKPDVLNPFFVASNAPFSLPSMAPHPSIERAFVKTLPL